MNIEGPFSAGISFDQVIKTNRGDTAKIMRSLWIAL
jgi:hypothetical protein